MKPPTCVVGASINISQLLIAYLRVAPFFPMHSVIANTSKNEGTGNDRVLALSRQDTINTAVVVLTSTIPFVAIVMLFSRAV